MKSTNLLLIKRLKSIALDLLTTDNSCNYVNPVICNLLVHMCAYMYMASI